MTIIMVTMYEIVFTQIAKTQYDQLSTRLKNQIDKGIERISVNPKIGKPLRGKLKGIYSERVATFRILYTINKMEIELILLSIEHRKSVYGGH